jgi:hypothetical protein
VRPAGAPGEAGQRAELRRPVEPRRPGPHVVPARDLDHVDAAGERDRGHEELDHARPPRGVDDRLGAVRAHQVAHHRDAEEAHAGEEIVHRVDAHERAEHPRAHAAQAALVVRLRGVGRPAADHQVGAGVERGQQRRHGPRRGR